MKVFIDTTKWVNVREERAIPTLVGNNYVDKIEVYYNSNPATGYFYPSLNILKSNGRRLSDIGFDSANPTYPRTFIDDDNVTWYYFAFTLSSERGQLDVTGQYQISITTNFYDDNNTITAQRNINTILNIKNAVKSSNGKVLIFSDNPADDVVDVKNEINNLKTSSANLSANKADKNNPEQTIIAGQVNANGFKQNGNDVLDETDVVDNLTTNDATKVLSAKQGKVLKDRVEEIADSQLLKTDIVDNLNSDDSQKILSAKMGKKLQDEKQPLIDSSNKLSADLVDDSETTNKFVTSGEKSTWSGKQDALTFDDTPTADSNNPVKSGGVYSAIHNVMEVAEGKTRNYVISDASSGSGYYNTFFNSELTTVTITIENSKIKDVNGNDVYLNTLKIGDIISIVETDVPDRWVGSITSTTVTFYALEIKLDVDTTSGGTQNSTKLITSGAVYSGLAGKQDKQEQVNVNYGMNAITHANFQKLGKNCLILYINTSLNREYYYYPILGAYDDYGNLGYWVYASLNKYQSSNGNTAPIGTIEYIIISAEQNNDGNHNLEFAIDRVIDRNVSNLTNYYPMSVTYTKTEVNNLLAAKQDLISDLATIRSNASDGKEAYDTLSSVDIEDDETDYIKDIPSSAKGLATLTKVGGMSYKSENLIGLQDVAETTTNGITYKVENGVITLNGTATNGFSFFIPLVNSLPIGTYSYNQFNKVSGHNFYLNPNANNDNSFLVLSVASTSPIYSNFTTINVSNYIQIYISVDSTYNNYSFTPMLVKGSTAPTQYQPYFEGIRDSAVTSVVSKGANLIDISKITDDRYVKQSDGTLDYYTNVCATDYISVEVGKSYYFSGMTTLNSGNTGAMYDSNKNYVGAIATDNDIRPLLIPSGVAYIRLSIWKNKWADYTKAMLNKGTTALPYTPYKVLATHPIASEIQALEGYGWGVNDTCYNYIDFERKVFVQKVGKLVIDGVNNTNMSVTTNESGYTRFTVDITNAKFINSSTVATLLSYFNAISFDGMLSAPNNKSVALYSSSRISFYVENINTLVDYQTYFTNNPLTVYYELATPVETDISSYLGDKHIPIEANGSLTFTNTYNQAVPSSITYDCGLIEVVKTNHEHDLEQQKDIDNLKENKQDRLYLHHIVLQCNSECECLQFKLLRKSNTQLTLADLMSERITEVKAFDRVAQMNNSNHHYFATIMNLSFYETSETTLAFNIQVLDQISGGYLDYDGIDVEIAEVTSVTDTVTPL